MLVRIGESEKEPRFVNVSLVVVVIIQSISFDMHQNKFSACVLNLLLEYHWAGRPTSTMYQFFPFTYCFKALTEWNLVFELS